MDGADALRKKCKEVGAVNDHIRLLLDDMMETLHHTENDAALAANQTGILRRLAVIDYCDQKLKLVNPKIVEQSGTTRMRRIVIFMNTSHKITCQTCSQLEPMKIKHPTDLMACIELMKNLIENGNFEKESSNLEFVNI